VTKAEPKVFHYQNGSLIALTRSEHLALHKRALENHQDMQNRYGFTPNFRLYRWKYRVEDRVKEQIIRLMKKLLKEIRERQRVDFT
jgi:hypothetical protein